MPHIVNHCPPTNLLELQPNTFPAWTQAHPVSQNLGGLQARHNLLASVKNLSPLFLRRREILAPLFRAPQHNGIRVRDDIRRAGRVKTVALHVMPNPRRPDTQNVAANAVELLVGKKLPAPESTAVDDQPVGFNLFQALHLALGNRHAHLLELVANPPQVQPALGDDGIVAIAVNMTARGVIKVYICLCESPECRHDVPPRR
mmetsp:Transcript_11496/g.32218  ORF Transcript_11496/g.32218 Transcript_11496/m.32218 type:complete len:202 (+) Transcript_11496:916-1521(+)